MSRLAKLVFAVALLSPVACFAGAIYKVSAQATHAGATFAEPVLFLKEGTAGVVEVSGKEGYKLSLTVSDAGHGHLKVDSQLNSAYGSISPSLVVDEGKVASVSIGDLGLSISAVRQAAN